MHVGNPSSGEFIDQPPVSLHPTIIKQGVLSGNINRFDRHVETTIGSRIINSETYQLACLSLEKREIILACPDGLAVDLLNDTTRFDTTILHSERPLGNHLLDLEAVSLITIIEESA